MTLPASQVPNFNLTRILPFPTLGSFAGVANILSVAYGNNSLGGYRTANALPQEEYNPLLMSLTHYGELPLRGCYRLFPDIENSERAAGKTDYRGIFLRNLPGYKDATAVNVWLTQPSQGTITVGAPTINADGSFERVATDTTAPATPVFTSPTSGAPLALGACAAGGNLGLFIKRVTPGTAATKAYDFFVLSVQATTSLGVETQVSTFGVFWSVKSGVASMTVAQLNTDNVGMSGDVFTVTCLNSAGAAVDPPGNALFVSVAQPFQDYPRLSNLDQDDTLAHLGGRRGGTFLDQAFRTATGIFRWAFKPNSPGHKHITFDAGGEIDSQIDVEVSPMTFQQNF